MIEKQMSSVSFETFLEKRRFYLFCVVLFLRYLSSVRIYRSVVVHCRLGSLLPPYRCRPLLFSAEMSKNRKLENWRVLQFFLKDLAP